jgi:hypothetical protein
MTESTPLSSERLRALASEVVAVVQRHMPDWAAPPEHDPGLTLLEVFAWLADTLSEYQDQVSDEAALRTRRRFGVIAHHVLSEELLTVTVDGARWRPSAPGPGERAYVVETGDDGTTTIRFGDGVTGAQPPVGGSEVTATYRTGDGAVGVTTTVRWPPESRELAVRLAADRLVFEPARSWPRGLVACVLECLRRRG